MKIGNRDVGPGHPTMVIAEISCNHVGNYDFAAQLVKEAAAAGADAVKFTLYYPDHLAMPVTHPAHTLQDGLWAGRKLWDLYYESLTPWEWIPDLKAIAEDEGVLWGCTVHHQEAIDFLERLDCPFYKIASPEFYHLDLIRAVAATKKPMFLSYGAAFHGQAQTLGAIVDGGNRDNLCRMHCVSKYPTELSDIDIPRMRALYRDTMNGDVFGFSDHTVGWAVTCLAVAFGAHAIEKHIMLPLHVYYGGRGTTVYKESDVPLDREFSEPPFAFHEMVKKIREVELALTKSDPYDVEFMRRLVWAYTLPPGTVIERHHLRAARCREGLLPSEQDQILGHRLSRNVLKGDPVSI